MNRMQELRSATETIFNAGIRAVGPEACINKVIGVGEGHLQVGDFRFPFKEIGRLFLIGAGKASAAMAAQAEALLGSRIHDGLVITKYGHGEDLKRCRIIEAGHPVPDQNGEHGAGALLDLVSQAGPRDLILCMISGGASALTPAPAKGITLADKQETTRQLLGCGANIHEINTIRKHLSRIKGGQLCRKSNGARMISLILSDVVGDDLDIIGSGMTAPDTGSFRDCRDILGRYRLWDQVPEPVRIRMEQGISGQIRETPKPGAPEFAHVTNLIVGSLSDALEAARKEAENQGYSSLVLSSTIQGEACEVAKVLCAIAREVRRSGQPIPAPACLLFGGETTVSIQGTGKGGRNMELALAAGMELAGEPGTLLLSAGTDGTDGPTDAAGAFADGFTTVRAGEMGLSAAGFLGENDSYHFFKPLGDLLITGPTRTNVMDLQIFLIAG